MKQKVKLILKQYSAIQLLLLSMYGNSTVMDDIDNELDQRSLGELKGQDEINSASSRCSRSESIPVLS